MRARLQPPPRSRFAPLAVLAIACGLVTGSATAQDPTDPPPQPTAEAVDAAVGAWVRSAHDDRALLDQAVSTVVAADRPGFRAVKKLATSATERRDKRGLEALIQNLAIRVLEREIDSGMFFAGQFAALEELQPYVGRVYLGFVLDTPDWFPEEMRHRVVPALRDLYPDGPDRDTLRRLRDVAGDAEFEREDLRVALGFALAQWGDRSLVDERFRWLEKQIEAGEDDEDRLPFVRQLAFLHYHVRAYDAAADTWLRYLRGSERLELRVVPEDYYNAACNLSLAGRIDDALVELARCGELNRAETTDESQRLERKLFDRDPELRAIRSTKRFEAIVTATFPAKKKDGGRP